MDRQDNARRRLTRSQRASATSGHRTKSNQQPDADDTRWTRAYFNDSVERSCHVVNAADRFVQPVPCEWCGEPIEPGQSTSRVRRCACCGDVYVLMFHWPCANRFEARYPVGNGDAVAGTAGKAAPQ